MSVVAKVGSEMYGERRVGPRRRVTLVNRAGRNG